MNVTSIHAFAEKVVLITDGTNSFGRAVAMQLALNGAFVIVGIPEKDTAGGTDLIEDLASLGTLVKVCNWNSSDKNGPTVFVDLAAAFFGRVDLLVNTLQGEAPEDREDVQIDHTLWATFSVTKNAVKVMDERPKPRIVTVIANCCHIGNIANVATDIVEHGMAGMTYALSQVLPKKFRVNAVRVVGRKDEGNALAESSLESVSNVAPDDVARTVLFLLSGEAVGVNGQVIDVS